jgi:uncharacterized membrane protein YdbT with pleckstrin-like domain
MFRRSTNAERTPTFEETSSKPTRYHGLPLHAGEEVVLVVKPSKFVLFPKYLFSLGLYALWRNRDTTVLTDRRVLIGKGLFSRSERSIPLSRVRDAMLSRRGYASYTNLILNGADHERTTRIGPLLPRKARELTSTILNSILNHL